MMYSLYKKLRKLHIDLEVIDDQLKLSAPDDKSLTPSLLAEIKSNKQELILFLKKYKSTSKRDYFIPLTPVRQDGYPISDAQRRLWILNKIDSGATVYNLTNKISLHKAYDLEKLEAAFQAVIAHHEILRTVFREDEFGEVKQWVLNASEVLFKIQYLDLSKNSELEQENIISEFIKADALVPYNFETGPLLRAAMFQLSEESSVFYFNMHHIISDGWSMNILLQNIMTAYEALSNGRKVKLPELRIQYKDYAAWQLDQLKDVTLSQHKNYWLEQLSGLLPTVDFPSFNKRPAVKTNNGRKLATYINNDTVQKLKAFCLKEEGSLYMGLLTVFNALFYRYAKQGDCIVGTSVAGRNHGDLEDQIGFYVNTLALRNKINPGETFKGVFANTRQNTLNAFNHQAYPFNKLISDLSIKRDLSRHVLFDVMLNLHNQENNSETFKLENNDFDTIINNGAIPNKFDLELDFTEVNGNLCFEVTYNSDVYDKASIENLMRHYKQLLAAMLTSPELDLNQINYLSKSEIFRLETFNDTNCDYNLEKSLLEHFRDQTSKDPLKTALKFGDDSLTFGELDRKSTQLAVYIQSLGLQETLIPICFERSFEMVISLLGILKSGNAYVPIDPNYLKNRIQYILEDTEASYVLTQTSYADFFKESKVIDLNLFEYKLYDISKLNSEIDSSQLAYCIYTSGTTGNSKGVLNSHKALLNRLFWMRDKLDINSSSVLLQKTPYVFDVSVWELTIPFVTGSTLVIARPNGHSDADYLKKLIDDEKVSIIHFVPSMLNVFLDAIESDSLKTLKHVVCSGEALSPSVVTKFKNTLKEIAIYNLYGPTEAAIDVTFEDLTEKLTDELVTIGKATANTQLYIVNEALLQEPIGVAGELLIGGVQVAKGYVNKPNLTNEKFIKDKFTGKGTLYKTGDIVRRLPDGCIEYLGRIDEQVKIRGYRIELGEVINHLEACEKVNQAVVTLKKDGDHKRLIGYLVGEKGLNIEELKTELKSRLPEYMMPWAYVILDEMPLTINGKVDRKQLPDIENKNFQSETYVAPKNDIESKIAGVWQELLGLDTVGTTDNFFSLGGDSIIAIQFVNRIKKQGIELKAKDVFSYQTIGELAKNCNKDQVILSEQGVLEGAFKLGPIQKYFFENSFNTPHHYNQSLLLTLPKIISKLALQTAVSKVFKKHDILRAQFVDGDNGCVATYLPEGSKMKSHKVSDKQSSENGITEICEQYQQGLSLVEGKIAEFVFIETPKLELSNRLFIVIHHLAVDGVSWRLLVSDLESYLGDNTSQSDTGGLLKKTTSFRQWQDKLYTYAQEESLLTEYPYWKSVMSKYKKLPEDKLHESDSFQKAFINHNVQLSKKGTKQLLSESHHAFNTEINDLLIAALTSSICEWANEQNIVIGLEGHGRNEIFDDVDLSGTLGWFTTLYPVTLKNKIDDLEAVIIQSKETLRSVPNKGLGYGMLRYLNENASIRQSLNDNIDQLVFNYLGQIDQKNTESGLFRFATEQKGADIGKDNQNRSSILINGFVSNGKLSLNWTYDSNRYEASTIEMLAANYIKSLEAIIAFCHSVTIPVLTPADYGLNGLVSYEELSELQREKHSYELEDIYRLSPLQEGILFHSMYKKSPNAYVQQVSFDIEGDFSMEYFKTSWKMLMANHSVFRTSFYSNKLSLPVQCLYSDVKLPLEVIDLTSFSLSQTNQRTIEIIEKEANTPFNLDEVPLFRLILIQKSSKLTRFIFTFHHILCDGWSVPIIFSEFLNVYKSLSKNSTSEIVEFQDNYSDYIKNVYAKKKTLGLTFWKNHLKPLKSPSLLPFSNTSEEHNTVFGNTKSTLSLEKDFVNRLENYAQTNHITLNTIVQGVWAFLLSQYTNNDAVVFGTVISGRPTDLKNVESRIGLYINTVPFCNFIDKSLDVSEWFKDLQSTYATAREEHGHFRLSEIQSQTDVGRFLFDSLLVFESYPLDSLESAESDLEIKNIETRQQNNYALTISINYIANNKLVVDYEYNSSILSDSVVKMIRSHFENLLESVITSNKISDLEFLDQKEKTFLLEAGVTKPTKKETLSSNVVEAFQLQVSKTPKAIAIIHEEQEISYEELDSLSNQFADYLTKTHNVTSGDRIGLKLDRSSWVMVSILGILKTGSCYVPIDPTYSTERDSYILEDANLSLLVTESTYIFDFSDYDKSILAIDIEFDSKDYNAKYVVAPIEPKDLSYIIYTSGSTGQPKGVMVSHGAAWNYLSWSKDYYLENNVLSNYNFGLYSSISFDLTVTSLFLPILSGGTLHIFSQGDVSHLLESYLSKNISCIKLTPAHIFLLKELKTKNNNLELVITGGDALLPHHVTILQEINPSIKILNEYGPTEATVGCMIYEVTSADKITIGKPIDNMEIYLLSKSQKMVPQGISGEIYIGGLGLAEGYLNKEELTNSKFISHPLVPAKKIYKTGDIGHRLPDGNLIYSGREDDQVKIRGNRIELGEIEQQLLQKQSIKDVVVLASVEESQEKSLIAYIVLKDSEETTLSIRKYLERKLPNYMIPAHFVSIEEIPLTLNGKVDKKVLLALDGSGIQSGVEYVAPEGELQEKIASILEEHLELSQIGIHDDYFHLGGDSIKVIPYLVAINNCFDLEFPISLFYKNPTIEGIASYILDYGDEDQGLIALRLEAEEELQRVSDLVLSKYPNPETIASVYPISDIQMGMALTSELMKERNELGIYHDQFLFQVGTVNIDLLTRAMELMVDKYETLRTTFNLYDFDIQVQIIHKSISVNIGYEDISDLEKEVAENHIETFLVNEREKQPFDLSKSPNWRINVFQIKDSDIIFVFQFHHAILDGWSQNNFKLELFEIYNALEANENYSPTPLNIGIKDSILSDFSELNNQENISFWKTKMENYNRLNILSDKFFDRKIGKSYSKEFTDRILDKCKKDKLNPKALFFSGYFYVMSLFSESSDMTLGLVSHRRPVLEDSDKLLGCFLNSVPFRYDITNVAGHTWKSYVNIIQEQLDELKGKDRFSLNSIVGLTEEDSLESSGRNPFFDVLFNYVNFHVLENLYENEDFMLNQSHREVTDFTFNDYERTNTYLDFTAELTGSNLSFTFTQTRSLESGHSLENLLEYLENYLENYLNREDEILNSMSVIPIEEQAFLIKNSAGKCVEYPKKLTVVDMFTNQVLKTPDATALVFKEKNITYLELDQKSNQLAHYLRNEYNIKKENFVGIKLERSEWMAISVLGILKAGGSYVPIDPNYPLERIDFIEKETNCKVCIDEVKLLEISLLDYPKNPLDIELNPENLAYVMYTSGSTGKPKGVMIKGKSLVNYALTFSEMFNLSYKDKVILQSSLSFDAHVMELFATLISGGIVLISENGGRDIEELKELIRDQKATILGSTPQVLNMLNSQNIELFDLRLLIGAGDKFTNSDVSNFLDRVQIFNMYGPTEATVCSTFHELRKEDSKSIIGKPISNRNVYIVNELIQLRPKGAIGEICIGGDVILAKGYLNMPRLTKDKFIANPFKKGERLYTTGDLGRLLPDGSIEFIGRKDNQVKIRGYRIELGEIEHWLSKITDVKSNVVVVKEDEMGNKELVAYLILKKVLNISKLREELNKNIPDYMIPSHFVQLEKMPLNSNDKIDRKLLPNPDGIGLKSGVVYVAPRNEIEEKLVLICEEVLGRKGVGIKDSFFTLGGNSLKVVQLISRIRNEFGIHFEISMLYKHPTIDGLSSQLENILWLSKEADTSTEVVEKISF